MNQLDDILSKLKISDVYQALGGPKLRGMRGSAFWRGGDGLNVSMDDGRGVWHDFATDEGGGILDLVVRVLGGARQDALRWCADFAGVLMDDSPLSGEDRARWAEERRLLEQDLPRARYWRQTAIALSEELLVSLKAALFSPQEPQPGPRDIQDITGLLVRLQRLDDAALVGEFRWWRERFPGMTDLMIRTARAKEQAARRALRMYLRITDPERLTV